MKADMGQLLNSILQNIADNEKTTTLPEVMVTAPASKKEAEPSTDNANTGASTPKQTTEPDVLPTTPKAEGNVGSVVQPQVQGSTMVNTDATSEAGRTAKNEAVSGESKTSGGNPYAKKKVKKDALAETAVEGVGTGTTGGGGGTGSGTVIKEVKKDDPGVEKAATEVSDEIGDGRTSMTYEDMFKALYKDPELSPEELKKKNRQERIARISSAIADFVNAGILMGTGGGMALNIPSQSEVTDKRFKEAQEKYNTDLKFYKQGLMNARQQDMTNAWKQRVQDREDKKLKLQQDKYESDLALRQAKQELNELRYKDKSKLDAQQLKKLEAATAVAEEKVKQLELENENLAKYGWKYKPGSGGGSSKRTYKVGGETYTNIHEAKVALIEKIGKDGYDKLVKVCGGDEEALIAYDKNENKNS